MNDSEDINQDDNKDKNKDNNLEGKDNNKDNNQENENVKIKKKPIIPTPQMLLIIHLFL